MKAAPFAYCRPVDVDEAVEVLARGDAKVLAGGQSLVPVLAMRLGRPGTLVDITAVPGLDTLEVADGVLRVGAAARQRRVERSSAARAVPLIGRAMPFVGHRELRSRGTVCGSLAHADPAAELPAIAACLGATFEVTGPSGSRTISAADFVAGAMTTAVGADELLTAVNFPVARPGDGFGFAEIARRHGDFALAGVVVRVRRSGSRVEEATLVGFGISDRPVVRDVTSLLAAVGSSGPMTEQDLRADTAALAAGMVDTGGDAHGSTGYRARLLGVLAARELAAAWAEAGHPDPQEEMTTTEHGPGSEHRAGPRPVHVAADATAAVAMTVNGSAVSLEVAPRTTLSDVLRDRLGLTGTHVGCEHGVCGMCTVLVDGEAARACLLFAVQCEGAEILTVEGLGTADDQHPLQQAFSHHHGLQCGFCTPGMLMSSYDLLAGGTYDPDSLAEDMSGVLCRCTGYRGILAAVADVGMAHPDGVPGPMACAARTLVGRTGGTATPTPSGPADGTRDERPVEVGVPSGPPTVVVELTSELGSPVEDVWAVLADFERFAACLPGAEMTADLGDDRYRGRARIALGPVSLSFDGVAHVVEHGAAEHRMRVLARGADAGGSSTHADIRLVATPRPDGGTTLSADADVHLVGRIAQFGRALADDVSWRLFEQFATTLDETARTGTAPTSGSGPSPLRLAARVVVDGMRACVRSLARRVRRHR